MPKILLTRSQMRSPRKGFANIDVTVKSAKGIWRDLAPTWEMVLAYKSGELAEEKYTREYVKILMANDPKEIRRELKKMCPARTGCSGVNFQCYCRDGVFCHTHLLIDWLVEKFPRTFTKKQPKEKKND